jgi:hypothetical protein
MDLRLPLGQAMSRWGNPHAHPALGELAGRGSARLSAIAGA